MSRRRAQHDGRPIRAAFQRDREGRRPTREIVLVGLLAAALGSTACGASDPDPDGCGGVLANDKRSGNTAPSPKCLSIFNRTGDESLGVRLATGYDAVADTSALCAVGDRLIATAQKSKNLDEVATLLYRRGDYGRAGSLWRRALTLAQRDGSHREAALAAYGGYMVALNQSASREALEALEVTRVEAAAAGDRAMLWRAVMGSFEVLFDVGAFEPAREALEKGKALVSPAEPEEWKYVAFREGLLDLEERRYAMAKRSFVATRVANQQSGSPDFTLDWYVALNLLEADVKGADVASGRVSLAQAEDLVRAKRAPDNIHAQVALLYNRARLRQLEDNRGAALVDVDAALAKSPTPEWLWQLWSFRGELMQAAGRAALAAAAYQRATDIIVELAEKTSNDDLKASVLANKELPFARLIELQIDAGNPSAALKNLERARSRSFMGAFARVSAGTPTKDPIATLFERADLVERILPKLRTLRPPVDLPIGQQLRRLSERHVLIYAQGRERLFILEVTRGQLRVHERPIAARNLAELTAAFVSDSDRRDFAARLGELLFPKAIDLRGEVLYIAPGATLAGVPFSALRRSGRYLVEQCAPVEIPNLDWLAKATRAGSTQSAASAVVIGNPQGDLPGSDREAHLVADLLHTTATTGMDATAAVLKGAMGARILHLSGHAGIDSAGPWLALARERVRIQDILSINPAARTVVLSNCASAATQDPGLWGSLAAAFLASGAHTVVASLRSISDVAAPGMMVDFYRQGGAEDPVMALAKAQRIWSTKTSPAVWASFIALGAE